MSDVEDFTLPHPLKGQSQFELLVMTRLNQFGEMLAQIHQLVSPPDTPQEGEGLHEVMVRMANALDRQGSVLEQLCEQVARLERGSGEAAEKA